MSHSPGRALLILTCTSLLCVATVAFADDAQPPKPSDATAGMLEAMREKGILTEEEYEDLYKRQALYEMEQREKDALPAWIKGWTFGGDATFRYDNIDRGGQLKIGKNLNPVNDPVDLVNGQASAERARLRLRLRVGAEHTVGEDFLVGFRIATAQASAFGTDSLGGFDFSRHFNSDPRSAFVTLGDYFAPKGIALDRMYITFAPHQVPGLTATAGKMQNPFVSQDFSSDFMVWDNDISTEGVQLGYGMRLFDERAWIKLHGGYYMIDEVPAATVIIPVTPGTPSPTTFPDIDEKDPFMYAWQLDVGVDITPTVRFGNRFSFYDMRDINARTAAAMEDLGNGGDAINHNPLFAFAAGQPFQTNGASRGHARELVYDVFGRITPWENWTFVPWFQLTHMLDASSENYGYSAGFDFLFPTNTRLTFLFSSMPRNGTIALFTDSDFFDGFVNARGWGLTLVQNINQWTTIRASYYTSEQRNIACGIPFNGITTAAQLCDQSVWDNPALALFRRQVLDRDRYLVDLSVKF